MTADSRQPDIPTERSYWRNILSIISFKAVAITLLWYICFANPPADHMTDKKVFDHMMSSQIINRSQ